MSPLPVRTERLLLRGAVAADHDDLLAYYSQPAIMRYVPFDAVDPRDPEALARRLQGLVDGVDPSAADEALHVMIDLDGTVVGDILLRLTGSRLWTGPPSAAEVGWILNPSYTGRGIATEAARAVTEIGFTHYGLHRVSAQLDPRNTASATVCERLGMRLEGTMRADFWSRGEWTDTAICGVLREEWTAHG